MKELNEKGADLAGRDDRVRARREWNEDGSNTYTWFYTPLEDQWQFDESIGQGEWRLELEPIQIQPGDRVLLFVGSFPKK